jgi:hypothetical protein
MLCYRILIKWKNSFEIQSENRRNRGPIETYDTQLHDPLLSWISTGTSIKSDKDKPVL